MNAMVTGTSKPAISPAKGAATSGTLKVQGGTIFFSVYDDGSVSAFWPGMGQRVFTDVHKLWTAWNARGDDKPQAANNLPA